MSNHSVQNVGKPGNKLKLILAVLAVVSGVVGFYFLSGQSGLLRSGPLVSGLVVATTLAWSSIQGREFLDFAKEAVRETKKVVWPKRKEAMHITAIVFAFVLVMATFLWGIDKILEVLLYDVILSWKQ